MEKTPIDQKIWEVVPASSEDLSQILKLLSEAAQWLQKRGIDYWQHWHNPSSSHLEWVRSGLDQGEFRLVRQGSELLGMFRLSWNDELFWGPQEPVAGYIHSFTTNRRYHGQNLGSRILELIQRQCIEQGKNILRLDCGSKVVGLKAYYQSLGFSCVGTINFDQHGEVEILNLYEKKFT